MFSAGVRAILRLEWERFRHSLGWLGRSDRRFRAPTLEKNRRRSGLFVVLGLMFLVQSFLMTQMMIETYAERVLAHEEGVVGNLTFERVVESAPKWEGQSDEEVRKGIKSYLGFSEYERERMGLDKLEVDGVLAQFRENGIAGFRNYERLANGEITLRELEGGPRERFARLMGMIFIGLLLALLFMPMAIRQKNLAATSDHQEWLFTLPLRGGELLVGSFIASVLIRPLAYLFLWPLLTNLLIASGDGVLFSGCFALGVTLLVSVAVSGVEVFLDTWMRARAPRWILRNAQMVFSLFGLLSFYAILAACFAREGSFPWVDWLAVRVPGELGRPWGEVLISPLGVWVSAALVGAVILGFGGCFLAGKFMRSGWLSGNGLQTEERGVKEASLRGGSLLRFEALLLLRDRTLAVQVILVPLLIVGYQVLANPAMVQSVTAAGVCALAFAGGAYASLVTAPQLLRSEAKGGWMIYNLPVPVAAYFKRREGLWRMVATSLAAGVLVLMVGFSGIFQFAELWRYLAAILGVWVLGRVMSGVVMGRPKLPDAASGEAVTVSSGRMYAAMLMAGVFGAILWQGWVWPTVSALVIFWFLGEAIWQRREVSFSYLMEPVEEEPESWGVDDGLWAVMVFFVVQSLMVFFGVLGWAMSQGLVLLSFVGGGVAAWLFTRLLVRRKKIALPDFSDGVLGIAKRRVVMETALWTVLCVLVGVGWTCFLETGVFGEIGRGALEWNPLLLILLTVVAAPIFEELLFRGFMCRTMGAFWSRRGAIFGSALVFAVVHPAIAFVPVFLLGVGTAVLYLRSQSVVPGMVLHALYNLGIVGLTWYG